LTRILSKYFESSFIAGDYGGSSARKQALECERDKMTPKSELGPVGQTISAKLVQGLAPASVEVIDESHQHVGHAGARPDGESHFRVRIVAECFRGKSRVAQHRMVNAVLSEELRERVHALAIQSSAPE
jgi:BolA family transcriptional regulator, general stress-responsive regulator